MSDYRWAIPVMRAGYAGRGVTYLAVAGLSLWAIWRGGEAQGTGSALRSLSDSGWGVAVLWFVAIGLFAYTIWRGIDAAEDLEEYGDDAEGLVSRAGMIVTGLIHGAIAALALSLALGLGLSSGGGEEDTVSRAVGAVLDWPGGRWLVGFAATCTIGSGIYYILKGWKAKYREKLAANEFTRNYDWALRAGVMCNGLLILIIGGFLAIAAWRASEAPAGGLGAAFDWLASQPFGNLLVVAICIGLLGFAFFCFVNAAYRIIPRVPHDDIESLAHKLKAAS
ncbi:DUF1206 domain-containing protein [Jannaschia aquimarina]|uniref:DUF1206 domain-containing protein n=1 Tax=Jannaschia aquimarina TaxID=935700 RepID=A0A0D1CMH2_9RHOB|nr:DUF1206 domain-containing protein [Jannaschia aquimarina]KIT15987.1 hypothetical protein jaqu_22570 [Jannaschia aquimarina]SNS99407.1 protein of unknown function [Jannaschia aquimarina]